MFESLRLQFLVTPLVTGCDSKCDRYTTEQLLCLYNVSKQTLSMSIIIRIQHGVYLMKTWKTRLHCVLFSQICCNLTNLYLSI